MSRVRECKYPGASIAEREQRIDLAVNRIVRACGRNKGAVKALLSTPCKYRPGSVDKVAVMVMRHQLGVSVFLDGDAEMSRPVPDRPVVMGKGVKRIRLV